MEKLLKKRISRKEFLKTCSLLAATSIVALTSFNIFKKKNPEKRSYGLGPYGG